MMKRIRARGWSVVEAGEAGDKFSIAFDVLIPGLIVLSTTAIAMESIVSSCP